MSEEKVEVGIRGDQDSSIYIGAVGLFISPFLAIVLYCSLYIFGFIIPVNITMFIFIFIMVWFLFSLIWIGYWRTKK